VTLKWRHLTGSDLYVAVHGQRRAFTVHITFYKAVVCRRRQSRDRKWRHVTESDPEVTSFDRKSPGSGRRKPKLTYFVHFTSYKAVARRRRKSRDRKWRHVTPGVRKSPKSDVIWPECTGSGCRSPKTLTYCTFHFLQGGCSQEEAVMWQKMTSCYLRWLEMTLKWRHLAVRHVEVAVGQKLPYTVHFTSYKAIARRRRQSRERKWRHEASCDRKWSRSYVIWSEVTWKWL